MKHISMECSEPSFLFHLSIVLSPRNSQAPRLRHHGLLSQHKAVFFTSGATAYDHTSTLILSKPGSTLYLCQARINGSNLERHSIKFGRVRISVNGFPAVEAKSRR